MEKNTITEKNLESRKTCTELAYPYNLFEAIKNGRPHIEFPEKINEDNERGLILALSYLKEREREIIKLRYQDAKTLREIGQVFGFNSERSRQIIAHAVRMLASHKCILMINKGPQGYIEEVVEKRAKLIAEMEIEEAYKNGYQQGYKDGKEQVEERIPDMIAGSNIPIEELDITIRPYNCLKNIGAKTVFDLLQLTMDEINNIKNLGKKSKIEIAKALKEKNLLNEAWESLLDRV